MHKDEILLTSPSSFLNYWLINYEELLSNKSKNIFFDYYKNWINDFTPYLRTHYDFQSHEVVDIVSNTRDLRVLEIGCGVGTESLYFALKGAKVTGIDIRPGRLNVALERKEILRKVGFDLDVEFYNKNINQLEGKYDIIWMEQAFHHIEPRLSTIKKISELLCVGGSIIICEANAWNPFMQIMLFKKRGFKTIKEVTLDGKKYLYGDERILVPFLLNSYFNDYNITQSRLRYFRLFPSSSLFNKTYLHDLEKVCPQIFKPLFTHYLWVGIKSDEIKN